MIKIKPKLAGFPLVEATQIEMKSNPFILGSTDATVSWELFQEIRTEYGGETEPIYMTYTKSIANDEIYIPAEVVELWDKDEVIENYVLEQLGLERAENPLA